MHRKFTNNLSTEQVKCEKATNELVSLIMKSFVGNSLCFVELIYFFSNLKKTFSTQSDILNIYTEKKNNNNLEIYIT